MDTSTHNLKALFEQLGLDSRADKIETFIENHHVAPDLPLAEAPFWNASQASFIKDAIGEDADWCEVIDSLDSLLRQ